MADKFAAAFHNMTKDDLDRLIAGLAIAQRREDRRDLYRMVLRNVSTTCLITLWFAGCLILLGVVGYVPAVVCTVGYFTYRDVRRLSDNRK
jgi:hypothetical protein